MERYKVTAYTDTSLPVDYGWTANGVSVLGENKTWADFLASAKDGRLAKQVEAMKKAQIRFLLLEGPMSEDGGWTVGKAPYGRDYDSADNLLASVQAEGIIILHSPSARLTPRRLAAFYEWTGKTNHGSWKDALPTTVVGGPNKEFNARLSTLLTIRGLGRKRAEQLIKAYGLRESIGVTEAGLEEAAVKWLAIKGIGPKLVAELRKHFGN